MTLKFQTIKKYEEVIEDIQEAQVNAGGKFLRKGEIERMTVEELLKLLMPNGVEFNIRYYKLEGVHQQEEEREVVTELSSDDTYLWQKGNVLKR